MIIPQSGIAWSLRGYEVLALGWGFLRFFHKMITIALIALLVVRIP
jgi:hypothetical protein